MGLACLDNFIGITPYCNPLGVAPRSGLYITDLEGISLNLASKIVSGENKTGVELIRKKIAFAEGLVIDDMTSYVRPYFQFNKNVDVLQIKGSTPKGWMLPTPLYRGLKLDVKPLYSYKIRISDVFVDAEGPISNVSLKIVDGVTETDYTLNGRNNVLDYTVVTDTVYVLIDTSNISVRDATFSSTNRCGCKSKRNRVVDYVRVQGWNGITMEDRTFGLNLTLSVECDFDQFFCSFAKEMKYLFLYRSGIELVKEWISSERINEFTTIHIDHAAFLLERWQKEYDAKYKSFVTTIRSTLGKVQDDCVICKSLRYTYQI